MVVDQPSDGKGDEGNSGGRLQAGGLLKEK